MTWFDILLLIIFATLIALGVKRKLAGFLIGLGGLLLFRPLLVVFEGNPLIALILALLAGLIFGLISRRLIFKRRGLDLPLSILGGIGGGLLGLLTVLSLITAFEVEPNVNNVYEISARSIPAAAQSAVLQSRMVRIGRDILLYPLLEQQLPTAERSIYRALHNFMVVRNPWERSL